MRRQQAQLEYASLLYEAQRKREAVSTLLTLIEQSGSNAAAAKQAADEIQKIGSPDQIELAYVALTNHFPAEASFWKKLGDARFAEGKDTPALEAYQSALNADPDDADAHAAALRVEESLRLDPTRGSLSVRERAARWDLILGRMIARDGDCATPQAMELAKTLQKRPVASVNSLDEKVDATKKLWRMLNDSCPQDPVLAHVLAKLK
jgi:tetratricopeptide (TPR) repeat protein